MQKRQKKQYLFKTFLMHSNNYKNLNPGLIANYCYELVKLYNSFYQSSTILGNDEINSFRIMLSNKVGSCIKKSMFLLGIEVPLMILKGN